MALEVKNKIRDILLWINIGKMANVYFDKKSSWLYSKIDENDTEFTPEELQIGRGVV
jgi:hypothetical protein